MNCRDGEAFLADALASVAAQTFDDLEIVFWDNASTDRSAEIARSFGEKVRYFRSDAPLPLGEARNAALARAVGKYIAILDVDDRWLPRKLELQAKRLYARPEVALVYCDAYRVNSAGARLSRWSEERQCRLGHVLEELLKSCFISMSSVVVRRDVLEEVGWFNPRLAQVEDWDLYLRIAERHVVDYVDEVLVEERLHAHNASRDFDRVVDESCKLMAEWARRAPRYRALCEGAIALARFKQGSVRAYWAFRGGRLFEALAQCASCAALTLRHPVTLPRLLMPYATTGNRRVFWARFS
jgi:glycosyltransferase involved in cell wall biosynthesis